MKSFLQFLQRAYKYFRGTKRVWRKPPQCDLLIIDRGTASPLDEMFAHHNPHIMDIRGESINMLALLRAVPKIRLGAVAYLEAYIDFVKPKLILSRTDNNHTLWQLKRRPHVTYKVALIQNGWRTRHKLSIPFGIDSLFTNSLSRANKYFVIGSNASSLMSGMVDTEFEKVGSINLNIFDIGKKSSETTQSRNERTEVALVSTFRPRGTEMNEAQRGVYRSLDNFLAERTLKLLIIGNGAGTLEQNLEKKFFTEIFLKAKFEIGFFRRENNSYLHLNSNKWIVTGDSTLGYEALVTGVPVGFVLPTDKVFDEQSYFASTESIPSGAFWTRSDDPVEHERIFTYIDTVSDEQWEIDSGRIRDQLIVHDYGNTKIRAYVEGVLTDSL